MARGDDHGRGGQGPGTRQPIRLRPEAGRCRSGDFAFLVIGDTGEGDASQHVLRDQLITASRQDAVRFVVISSDVVYPTGAIKDYEAKFWLPFKGIEKPVYAIPGNHDWYDALEAFNATFLTPAAARAAMHARVEADLHLTSTTDERIDELIARAARLRQEYAVPTALQDGPFFQIQTQHFALIAVDTGVVKRVDAAQLRWLTSALAAARGKFIMVLLGHPLYALGHYQGDSNQEFTAIHRLLRDHGVSVSMAGDVHDFEYYAEHYESPKGDRTMHHFVNGGGGAYLSVGTALDFPKQPPTPLWAHYPTRAQLTEKIEAATPAWKRPAWWWTKSFGAWPSSVEWLSAAFDYNFAPFYQSFVEVRVEPSAHRVRFLPWGVHGRLKWSDIEASPGVRPEGTRLDAFVEWTVKMTPAS
ncbi:MAG: metallophosphoesterase family protein [Isosphaerales bacterium]